MPKLSECIETLQASTGGGVFTAENLTEIGFAETALATTRAICIKELYPKRNILNAIYYQTVQLKYEADLQEDDCYRLFRYPPILNVNSEIDGHRRIGNLKGDKVWTRVRSFNEYQNMKAAYGRRIHQEGLFYVLEPAAGLVRVFHDATAARPKAGEGESIFMDPLHELIRFNRQLDEYPITPECLSMVEQYLREGKFQRFMQRPSNVVANGADDVQSMTQGQ